MSMFIPNMSFDSFTGTEKVLSVAIKPTCSGSISDFVIYFSVDGEDKKIDIRNVYFKHCSSDVSYFINSFARVY